MANYPTDLAGFCLTDILPAVHGGHSDGGGLVSVIDHFLATLTRNQPSSWNLLGGIETLEANLHPIFLHFPIAFLFSFLLIELYGLVFKKPEIRRWANGLLYLGGVTAILTVISGLIAAERVPHGAQVHEIMQWHQRAGITVAVLAAALGIWRRAGGVPESAMALALSMVVTLIIGGVLLLGADMGGMMVYQHGVGVRSLQSASEHQHHLHNGGTPTSPSPKNPLAP